ncbi:hypothetical protein AB0D10_42530 [Kitasatospora sp. NPDC048545]|uniref:hypothetical protein n=1 Tax=Kitasatospora sp. NPDC048545 TaxID=3157208 RepID=UPI0033E288D1
MADQPIEPTRVVLAGERDSGTTQPPPPSDPPTVGVPDGFLPPPRHETPPPPAQPPAAPPPPPPASGAPGLPEPHEWWRRPGGGGGGLATATAPAPVYVTPAPVTYVTNNHHYYPAAPVEPVAPAHFSLARLRPAWNGTAAVCGLLLVPVTAHLDADKYGVYCAAAVLAGVGELFAVMKQRRSGWLVRLLSCHVAWCAFLTPIGLHTIGYLFTGV